MKLFEFYRESFAGNPKFRGDRSVRLELAGLYVTYASIWAIQCKEDVKARSRFGEINA